jgi:pimeloyl-ACP methyl ester carboxylesterase
MLPLLIAGLIVIVIFGGRLFLRQQQLVFRPSGPAIRTPDEIHLSFEQVWLRADGGSEIHGWWVPGEGCRKAMLFFHGSDGNISCELPTLQFLHSLGVSVLMVDYPGYGQSSGRPSERGCNYAAETAWSFVSEQKGFAAEDVIIYGQSLGSAVGVFLAARHKCAGLVFQSGFSSVPDMAALAYPFLPVRLFCLTKMNSLERVIRCQVPMLVLHSEDDEHIPIEQALRVYARAPGRKKFIRLRGHHQGKWQTVRAVRTAWEDLLTGRTDDWEIGTFSYEEAATRRN